MSNPTPFQIPYIQLPVSDPVRSADFYKNTLGMIESFPYNSVDRAAYVQFEGNIALG